MTEMQLRPPEGENLIGIETGREALSHTRLSVALNCLKKYEWQYVRRLEPNQRQPWLSLGSAYQKSIEEQDPEAGAALLKRERPHAYTQEESDRLAVEQSIVRGASALYLETYPPTENEQREVGYRVRLRSPYTGRPSLTFDLVGYADAVEDHGAYLTITENKLVGRIDNVAVRRLKLDRQIGLEVYGLWRATGKTTRVIRYRWMKKPSIKQRKDESIDDFCYRIECDYQARPDFYTHEEEAFRGTDDLQLIEAELWDWAEQLRSARSRGFFARNTSHCSDFGGCAFIDLCVQGKAALPLYRVRPERPTEVSFVSSVSATGTEADRA